MAQSRWQNPAMYSRVLITPSDFDLSTEMAALRAGKATVEYPGTNNPDLGALVHG